MNKRQIESKMKERISELQNIKRRLEGSAAIETEISQFPHLLRMRIMH